MLSWSTPDDANAPKGGGAKRKSMSGANTSGGATGVPGSATTENKTYTGNPGSSCRYDTSLGLLTKRFINLIETADEGTLDLNKGTRAIDTHTLIYTHDACAWCGRVFAHTHMSHFSSTVIIFKCL